MFIYIAGSLFVGRTVKSFLLISPLHLVGRAGPGESLRKGPAVVFCGLRPSHSSASQALYAFSPVHGLASKICIGTAFQTTHLSTDSPETPIIPSFCPFTTKTTFSYFLVKKSCFHLLIGYCCL